MNAGTLPKSESTEDSLAASVEPVSSLSRLVQLGLESESKMGMVLRAVKLGVSSSLCSVVSEMHSMTTSSLGLMHTLRDRYAALLAEELPTMNREECYQEYSRLSGDLMELAKLERKTKESGLTIVPLRVFLNERGFAKVRVALARGKKQYDKRESLKAKDARREMDRAMKK